MMLHDFIIWNHNYTLYKDLVDKNITHFDTPFIVHQHIQVYHFI